MGYPRAGIRWRDDTGWELRCPDCAENGRTSVYWPLTDEFWDKRVMTRCRACHAVLRRKWERNEYEKRGSRYVARMTYAAEYRQLARRVHRRYMNDYYWSDPEKHRARARDYYINNRDAILARRRERYYARKARLAKAA